MNLLPKKNPTTVNIGENIAYIEKELTSDNDLIRRSDAIKAMAKAVGHIVYDAEAVSQHVMNSLPAVEPKQEWIPCEERLPEDLEIVNVTFVNHRPLNRCYEHLKDKPFAATAIHYGNRWWWYSPICKDLLAEYGKSVCDEVDVYIEITAWQPLPEPWEGADDDSQIDSED